MLRYVLSRLVRIHSLIIVWHGTHDGLLLLLSRPFHILDILVHSNSLIFVWHESHDGALHGGKQ